MNITADWTNARPGVCRRWPCPNHHRRLAQAAEVLNQRLVSPVTPGVMDAWYRCRVFEETEHAQSNHRHLGASRTARPAVVAQRWLSRGASVIARRRCRIA